MSSLSILLLSFSFNFMIAFFIVRFIYYPAKPNKNYVFTFLAFNTIIFFVVSFLTNVELSIGVGFGLFAIFSVLRYRTDPISIREMTYLFIVLALPVMNSLLLIEEGRIEIIFANLIVILVLYILEKGWGFQYECSKKITFEKIELIRPEKRALLMQDLCERTGLSINRIEVGHVDFLRDTAELKIFYNDSTDSIENCEPALLTSVNERK